MPSKVHKSRPFALIPNTNGKGAEVSCCSGVRPLAVPLPLAHDLATIDELIDEGISRDGHEPVIRQAIAMALFQHIRLLQNGEQRGIDLRLPPDVLWPKLHHAIFNFEATRDGAEWIDVLAWKAKQILEQAELTPVLAHNDFSVNQMRFVGNQVRIVYDRDSLTLSSELISVGKTAASFTSTEQPGLSKSGATEEDTHAFLADYEAVRQKPFTASEQKIIQASILSRKLYGPDAGMRYILRNLHSRVSGMIRCWPTTNQFSKSWRLRLLSPLR